MTLPSQSQKPSGMPVPPQTPHSSMTLPSQSQEPSGMPVPPQTPHSSRTLPSQSHAPSGISSPQGPHVPSQDEPSPFGTPQQSAQSVLSPPHIPHSSNARHDPSSKFASTSKLHAELSVQPASTDSLLHPVVIEKRRDSSPKLSTNQFKLKVRMFSCPRGTGTETDIVPVTGVLPDGQPSNPMEPPQPYQLLGLISPNAEVKMKSEGRQVPFIATLSRERSPIPV